MISILIVVNADNLALVPTMAILLGLHLAILSITGLTGRTPKTLSAWHILLARAYESPSGNLLAATQLAKNRALALYLRSFQVDSAAPPVYLTKGFDSGGEADRYRHPIESSLARYFADRGIPIVGVENRVITRPSLLAPTPRHSILAHVDIPRIECADESWRDVVRCLMLHSRVIILFIDGPSVGVMQEVEMLRDDALARRTVVIIGARCAGEGDDKAKAIREWLVGFPHVLFEAAQTAHFYHLSREQPLRIMRLIELVLDEIMNDAAEAIEALHAIRNRR